MSSFDEYRKKLNEKYGVTSSDTDNEGGRRGGRSTADGMEGKDYNPQTKSYEKILSEMKDRYGVYSKDVWRKHFEEKNETVTDEDFDRYSKLGAEVDNPDWDDTFAPLDIFGWKPFGEGEQVNNMVTFAKQNSPEALKSSANALRSGGSSSEYSELINLINEYMTVDEKAIYNYYIGKGEKGKADEYLSALTDAFKQKQAGKMVEQADDKALELVFSAVAGLDQFGSGVKNIDNYITGSEGEPTSAIQYAQNEMSANNKGIWKVSNDLVMNIGNMAPSMVVGAFTGGLGGALTLGVSAVGNSYSDMRKEGYTANQARAYATLVGASETALQYALGGISKLGGKVTGGAISKFVSGLDSALAKTAIQLGGSMASEGLEESIQTVLEPAFKALVTGEEYEAAEWEEILYSGLLGALSAGVLESPGTVAGGVKTALYNRELGKQYGDQSQQIIDEALAMADGSDANALAEKYKGRVEGGKNLKGSQINRMLEAFDTDIANEDTSKVLTAVETRLTELGETGDVGKLAGAIYSQVMGEELSRSEKNLIKNSKFGERVANELDPINIASGEYSSSWAENIGTKRLNPESYNKQLYDLARDASGAREIKEQVAVGKNKADFENSTGEEFKASESGKTMHEDAEVTIGKVVSTDGGLKVELSNGKTVNASDVEFGSGAEAMMYEMVARMEVPADTANEILNAFKPTTAKQAAMYFNNIPLAYKYGTINYEAGLRNINMSESEKRLAYERGKKDAIRKAEANTKTASPTSQKTVSTKKNGIIFEDGFTYDEASANEMQKVSMAHIEVIDKLSNLEVHVFESKVEDGKRVAYVNGKKVSAPNGYFTDGNKIYIDFNAGNKGEGAMLYTMSHEVTHYIRKWNEKGFKELGDFLIEQYGKNKVSVTELIENQKDKIKARYKRENKALPSDAKLFDMAYEELVADAMSDMFADPRAYEKLAKLKAQNKTLWQKVGEAIKAVLDKLKSALGIYKTERDKIAVAQETHEVRAFSSEVYEKLQDLYIKAFVEADANYEAFIGSRNLNDFADAKNENSEPLFQYRAMEADEDTYRQMLQKWGKMTDVQINNLFTTIDNAMELIKDNLEILDYAWEADIDDRAFSPVKPNSDKLYQVSLDFSTLCRKRILQQTVQAQLQEALNKPLSREEGIAIRDALIALQEEGRQIEVACALCYVESARMKSPEQIKRFVENKEKVIKEFFAGKSGGNIKDRIKQAEVDAKEKLHKENPNGILGKDGKTKLDPRNTSLKALPKKYADTIRDAKRAAKESYKPTAEEQKLIEVAKGMTVSDFTSPEGLENLAKNYPALFDAYTSYVRNATKSKGIENDTWWRAGDSMKIGDVLIANMNRENGLRSQSWSDFQVIHILDYIASTIELATRNTKEQAYSKVPDYVELMGNTGVMINMSLIPTAKFNGTLDYDSVEGIDYKRALELRDKYHATAGTICIGVDNVQIKLLLADTTIDYVIPYHKSGMAAHIRKAMHIPTWSEYESYQSEKNLSRADAEKQAKKYGVKLLDESDPNYHKGTSFSEWFDLKEAQQIAKMENANPSDKAKQKKYGVMYGGYMAMQNAANNYLKLCAERGITPKFSHEKADFSIEENYWKLLIDRKMVDNVTGEVIEQQNIKPIFNQGEIMRILNDEIARYPKVKEDQDYAIRTVTEKMLSGDIKGGMSAKDIAKVMKKPVDNVTNVNIVASSEDMKLSDRDSYAPTFYSYMGKVIDDIRLEKMGANGVVSYLKGKGVKDEEIKWSGIEAFLEGKKSVTKAELQEFIAGSQLQIEEEMSDSTKLVLEDGTAYDSVENFKEAAYSLADEQGIDRSRVTFENYDDEAYVALVDDDIDFPLLEAEINDGGARWSQYKLDGGTNYRELVFKMPNSTYNNRAMRAHWGQDAEGVLAHARIQDMTTSGGKKMLFIEELQSDWHNEGHQKGYTTKEYEDAVAVYDKLADDYEKKRRAFNQYVRSGDFRTDPDEVSKKKFNWLRSKMDTAEKRMQDAERDIEALKAKGMGDVPDAPFRNNYHEYVLKRLLRMAAEEGYDSLGWTTADIQSTRWSEDYAEGYRIEYDQDIPKFLRKYGKKWGATVSRTTLNNESDNVSYVDNNGKEYKSVREWHDDVMDSYASKDDAVWSKFLSRGFKVVQDGQIMQIQDSVTKETLPETLNVKVLPDTVWSMDITDSMKESVLHEGQVLYSDRTDIVDVNGKEYDHVIELDYKTFNKVKRSGSAYINFIRINLINKKITVYNSDGEAEIIEFARANERVKKAGASKDHPVIGELTQARNEIKKLVILNAVETAKISQFDPSTDHNDENSHQWLDANGWDYRTSYVMTKDGIIYPVTLFVAKARDGRNILYDVNVKIKEGVAADKIATSERTKRNARQAVRSTKPSDALYHKDEDLSRGTEEKHSDRDPNAVSNRTILANALESVAQNDIEKTKLAQYKAKIALIESEQAKLEQIRAKANELRFTKGRTSAETKQMRDLDAEANQLANRISTYDKQLLNLESTTALKNVLEREKTMLRKRLEQKGKEALRKQKENNMKTVRELMTRHTESRIKSIEGRHKTEMRHKIKNVVSDLNKLLLNPTKDQHVPIGLQLPVAEALDAINMDSMNAAERVAYYNDLIAKSSDPDEIALLTKKRDFFEYRDANFKERITALKNAYAEFKESDDPLIRNAHNEAIEDLIKNTADAVGNKSLKDMSLAQLEAVHNMYKAILATVRNSNKLFKEGRQETITDNSEAVKTEVKEVGGHQEKVLKSAKFFKKFGWDMLKPVTAMKAIGSKTFEKLFNNVRAGEDTWAVDVNEAKQFYEGASDKYGFKKWDFKKRYSFKDSTGTEFSLSLEQIMSLYAYSKREQADKHLELGGFIFDDAIEVTEKNKLGIPLKYEVNDANPYRLRKEDLLNVTEALTKEQKAFIDEMQTYLSEVMGAKGNEVSLAMYDIKLYNETNYFPLKTSRYFREFDPEKSGTPKIKNAGFSKKTVPQAGNPIVLANFMDVWASHVNDMSMYHAFVLPLEDFMRVYNYSSTAGGYDSVQQYIKNAYGSQANQYIEKLMDDLNGGARVDSSAGVINKGISLFKRASVFASASVVVQQPSAIARAFAYINPKYFGKSIGSALNLKRHKEVWAEVKKYAPVAVIKEMGYFDTGVGRSTVEWLKGNKTFKDKMDDVLSKAPAIADELAWSHIWVAVKKETEAKGQFKVGTEEFLKESGRRFTEVITNTQVYDSVLSRSGMMRSKDTGMKMATAFMAEPTTTVNMMVDGIIQGKRGNKKFTAATVGAVSASVILNSILVSLVYAARDDDEDETYTEKYIGSLTTELLDGFNPLTYVPFVKDIWSIAQGYDVERSDMSVVSNLWESIEGLFNEDKSGWEKVADTTGAISSLFGIPLKNILRDAKGMYTLGKTVLSDTKTTKSGVGNSIEDSFKSSIPLWDRVVGTDSKSDNIYEAIVSGDTAYVERLKKTYKTTEAYETAVRKALRENDSRIAEAAQARLDGDISSYTRIAKEIIAEGYFSQDIVVGAINAEMTAIKKGESSETETTEDKDEVTSIYSASDVNVAFNNGNDAVALEIIDDLIKTKVANGMEEKNAKSSVRSSMTSYWKPLYIEAYKSGDYTEMTRIRRILLTSRLYGSASDVVKTVKNWLKS